VAFVVSYSGTPFQGWQTQPHAETVQGRLERAFEVAMRNPVTVYGSGRTDTGVHALAQVANAWVPGGTDLHKLRGSLNGLAGPDIVVRALGWVAPDFHARHSALGKCYRYWIHNRSYPPLFTRGRAWWMRRPLDLEAMRAAAERLIGIHDFSAFRAKECAAASAVRDLRRVSLLETGEAEGALRIEYEASGFLQHMARILTGTLVAVGLGDLSPRDIAEILASRRRECAAATAPGHGLHLVRVEYDLARFPELAPLLAEEAVSRPEPNVGGTGR
jgi:tRNA pseudouridine38-40 synthase